MKTYLIAGGAGFIGSHLCKTLLILRNKVICVDNLITGSLDNIDELHDKENFQFLDFDISKGMLEIDEPIDGVFQLASPASPNAVSPKSYINYPIETMLANSVGTKNLLDLAMGKQARFVDASTSEVYGNPSVSPQPESYWGNVNPNGIRSVYDESKRFGEAMTMTYLRKFNLDVRIARIFNTYGENMQKDDGRVVSNFINQAIENRPLTVYGKGEQTRSFCYVSDMVDGLISLMFVDNIAGQVVNLGNPSEYKIIEIAATVKELTLSKSEIIFERLPEDDPERRKPDIEKAKALLGFNPKVDLVSGLNKTIEYFKR